MADKPKQKLAGGGVGTCSDTGAAKQPYTRPCNVDELTLTIETSEIYVEKGKTKSRPKVRKVKVVGQDRKNEVKPGSKDVVLSGEVIPVLAWRRDDDVKTTISADLKSGVGYCGDKQHPHLVIQEASQCAAPKLSTKHAAFPVLIEPAVVLEKPLKALNSALGALELLLRDPDAGRRDYLIEGRTCGWKQREVAGNSSLSATINVLSGDYFTLQITVPALGKTEYKGESARKYFSDEIKLKDGSWSEVESTQESGSKRSSTQETRLGRSGSSTSVEDYTAAGGKSKTTITATTQAGGKKTTERIVDGVAAPLTGDADKEPPEIPIGIVITRNGSPDAGIANIQAELNALFKLVFGFRKWLAQLLSTKFAVGWSLQLTLSFLEGSLYYEWGRKVHKDNRVFMQHVLRVEMKVFSVDITIKFGLQAALLSMNFEASVSATGKVELQTNFNWAVVEPDVPWRFEPVQAELTGGTIDGKVTVEAGKPEWFKVEPKITSGMGAEAVIQSDPDCGWVMDYALWFRGVWVKMELKFVGMDYSTNDWHLIADRASKPWALGRFPASRSATQATRSNLKKLQAEQKEVEQQLAKVQKAYNRELSKVNRAIEKQRSRVADRQESLKKAEMEELEVRRRSGGGWLDRGRVESREADTATARARLERAERELKELRDQRRILLQSAPGYDQPLEDLVNSLDGKEDEEMRIKIRDFQERMRRDYDQRIAEVVEELEPLEDKLAAQEAASRRKLKDHEQFVADCRREHSGEIKKGDGVPSGKMRAREKELWKEFMDSINAELEITPKVTELRQERDLLQDLKSHI